METLFQDLRYGARTLIKRPGFTAVAIIALALGIGANTAIFSVINAVLLKPLPFSDPERLVAVYETSTLRGDSRGAVSYPDFADWRDQNHVFEGMAAFHTGNYTLTGGDEAQRLQGAVVSADTFALLGAAPILGRTFLPEEDKPGDGGHVIMLSHSLWQKRFDSDPNVIGRSLTLGGTNYTVVGVMPAGFQFPIQTEPVDLWATFSTESDATDGTPMTGQRGAHYMGVIARLKPGVTRSQAQAEMDTIASRLEQQYPDENSHRGANVIPALEDLVGDIRPVLLLLLVAVGCVLLIACANVANLLLARATTRHKEMAIRAALGASRARVLRQLLTESVALSLAGGALGLLLALWGTDLLVALSREEIPRSAQVGLDGRVLLFTLGVSILTGVIFGLVPAIQSSRPDLSESLKEGGRSSNEGARHNRIRSALVIAEVTVAIILLVGAALLIQSLSRLQNVNPGFNPRNVLALDLGLPDVKYNSEKQVAFYKELIERIEALPGVTQASAVLPLPLSESRIRTTFETEGRPIAKGDLPAAEYRAVCLNYFRTLGIPLIKGRDFTARDDNKSPGVIIVNQSFAEKFFPGEDALGKRIKPDISTDESEPAMREIVGVVGNVKHRKLSTEDDPEFYVPHAQIPWDFMTVVVKSNGDPRSLIGAIQGEVRAVDKDLPVYNVNTLEDYIAASVAQPRFNTLMWAIFAGLALVLTAVGLYGVMSYAVAQRTHEIGIRMALGAQTSDVMKLVVGHGMTLTLIGMAIGLIAAFVLTRLMASFLFGVSATDPATFAIVAGVLAAVAFAACYIPARRATKVDPMIALRYE
ncbi:MAG TPA: ABC transporter permease [Blastocatellia bacterium]|nr:ABC transporter permease [Blastocatellia bacterium]